MDLKKIQSLLKIVAESGVAEVEIEEEGFKLTVRRNPASVTLQAPYYPAPFPYGYAQQQAPFSPPFSVAHNENDLRQQQQQQQQPSGDGGASAGAAQEAAEAPRDKKAPSEDHHILRAPIVGTFYRRPSPDSEPYVEEGSKVKKGEVLCIIEAMKLMNEIECEVSGVIESVLVEDSQPVEYEQPLFSIRTGA